MPQFPYLYNGCTRGPHVLWRPRDPNRDGSGLFPTPPPLHEEALSGGEDTDCDGKGSAHWRLLGVSYRCYRSFAPTAGGPRWPWRTHTHICTLALTLTHPSSVHCLGPDPSPRLPPFPNLNVLLLLLGPAQPHLPPCTPRFLQPGAWSGETEAGRLRGLPPPGQGAAASTPTPWIREGGGGQTKPSPPAAARVTPD